MKSHLLHGKTWHERHTPSRHAFVYPMIWLCADLDELPALNRKVSLFGHNRRAAISIRDDDYAGPGAKSICEKVLALLGREGMNEAIARIDLITLPRVLGYAFNPVSFFRCYAADGSLAVLVVEVGNTFGEKHHYVLRPVENGSTQELLFRCSKAFYVSPFNRTEGEYSVRWREQEDSLWLEIELIRGGERVMSAGMAGKTATLSSGSLAWSAASLFFRVVTVMPLISWQALHLHFRRRVPIFNKPQPTHAATIPARRSGLFQRLHAIFVRAAATNISPVLSLSKENPL